MRSEHFPVVGKINDDSVAVLAIIFLNRSDDSRNLCIYIFLQLVVEAVVVVIVVEWLKSLGVASNKTGLCVRLRAEILIC